MTDTGATPRHLLSVWNPSYADDAMDRHLEVLLGWARAAERGRAEPDEVYVWWAKLRSPNRQQPLPHAAEVLALRAQIEAGVETHLYLTDYASLYVAHLADVTDEDLLREWPDEREHLPAYYEEHEADFWFLLRDIRRLVARDAPATIEELRRLRNVRYHGRPVSLYGGIVDLPLIVEREDGAAWFGDGPDLKGGRTWAERDAELRGETERMAAELRDNLLGADVWEALEAASRTFLTTGEAIFRSRRDDPGFDFSAAAVEYAKAVETELNALLFPTLRRALARAPESRRAVYADARRLDLGEPVPHQTLGTMRRLLEREETVRDVLRTALPHDWSWLEGVLPHELEPIVDLRNPAAHERAVRRGEMGRWRQDVLGIGCEGLLVRIARAKLRARP
ncbi:MAG: hypothetical protein RRA92_10795 [Gemmatimonadota bacterium]|nr:hypothetical protein [Gemmatimonadota bacterium]